MFFATLVLETDALKQRNSEGFLYKINQYQVIS